MEYSNNKENIPIDENIITDETASSLLFISNNDHSSHSTILEEQKIKQHSSHLQQQRRNLYQQYQPHLFYQEQQGYYNNSLPNSIVDSVQEYDDVSESSSMLVNHHVNSNSTTNILKNKNSNAFTTSCTNVNTSDNSSQHISTSTNDVDIYGHVYEEISHAGRYLKCAPSTESLLALLDVKQKNKKKYYNSSTLSLQQQQLNHYKKSPSAPNFHTPSTSSSPLVTEQRYFPYNRHQDGTDNEDQNDDMKKVHEEDHHDEYLEKYPTWYQASLLERKKKHYQSQGKIPTPNMIQYLLKRFKNCFGFQQGSVDNMFDHILTLLDSRRSRMETCEWTIKTLHAEYIGGPHANYKKWYFACQFYQFEYPDIEDMELKWQHMMEQKTNMERIQDISLWLLIWSEMSVLRFCPELLCFIFKLANDFYVYYEQQYVNNNNNHHQDPLLSKIAEEGDFLNHIVTPLYQYIYEQGWRQDQRRRERDHDKIIGYDDMNQYFWSFKNLSTLAYSLSDVAMNQEKGKGKKSKKKKKKNRDQELIMKLEGHQRYNAFKYIEWHNVFKKTFKEKRSWLHLAVNFTRIWLLHIVSFWFFIIPNATALYIDSSSVDSSLDTVMPLKARGEVSNLENEVANISDLQHFMDMVVSKEMAVVLSMTALGGGLATLIMIFGAIVEFFYVPMHTLRQMKWLFKRISLLFLIFIINVGPSVYCLKIQRHGQLSQIIAVIQLIISVITTLYFILKTPSSAPTLPEDHKTFVAHFPSLSKEDRYISIGLWGCVFGCKLIESYFFLALSFKDPLASILTMTMKECPNTDGGGVLSILLNVICQSMPRIISIIMILTELVLFFLDTYLWYVIWNTIFSVIQSFYLGISILTPWRNVFARLPKRIYTKILSSTYSDENQYANPKLLCSQIWNSFILTMYREHLLSSDHVTKLLYQQSPVLQDGKTILKAPSFFVSQEDSAYETEYYPPESEAERRLQFLATSLSSPMPEALPVPQMPTFTVMTPHYNEKIILDLREIIKQDDQHTKLTLLEYLQHLHPFEWENFVNDTKLMASSKLQDNDDDDDSENNSFFRKMRPTRISEEEQDITDTSSTTSSFTARNDVDEMDDEGIVKTSTMKPHSKKFNKLDDLPFYCIGFKDPTPEYTLRTRIWASLRSQTLYRTITGFMNYHKAIKLLYRVENPEGVQMQQQQQGQHTSMMLDQMANRKFKFLIAMQRYMDFTHEENENVEFIFKSYPNLQVAYIENNINEGKYYSCLIDGNCPLNEFGKRQPKYRIQLPGNPILGDGKSDNQNTAIIYHRGEFLQLIDANQDNYLEECLKIRSVLGEFEGSMSPSSSSQQLQEFSPYDQELLTQSSSPVAIVGAREYIFSEKTGVLGDVAAGKEQTFGTLTQRVMATIGGRLHYGHPDFLNAIFMTTRGGVSKAQKGLHLNEDIYAGMNAFQRGGRIKHVDYYQCAKGRDLGFQSILNFVTKIGSGMGEQMLSREYYHLGTNLPLDRFLTFYYAHPGFHINNVFIMLAIQLFLLVILLLSAIRIPSLLDVNNLCDNSSEAINSSECTSTMDHHLIPVFHWIKRVVLSIFVVLLVSFMPLFMHELTERGFWRALSRLFKHFTSMSPMFEIFVTQVYSRSILQNLSFGGAKYISTGRGFAITRQPFSSLYMRFADISLYLGIQHFLILLFASMIVWMPHLVYFWFTVCALILSPFLFNPHQFSLIDFLVDYKDLLYWFSTGNSNRNDKNFNNNSNSWIGFYRMYRMQLTGIKRNQNTSPKLYQPRPKLKVVLFSEIILPFIYALFCMVAYLFIHPTARYGGLLRLGAFAMAPIAINALILLPLFFVSLIFGSLHGLIFGAESKIRIGSIIAIIAHTISIMSTIGCFAFIYFLEHWKLPQVLLAIVAISSIQRFIFKSITLCLTREFYHGQSHLAWWTGKWFGRKLGWHVLTQPFREYICKIIEMSQFSIDFIIIHMILLVLFLICLIPNVDQYHSWILFWTKKPKKTFIFNSKKQKKKQQHTVITSTINYGSFYTIRQKKIRRRIAFIYGFLFVCTVTFMLALFIAPSYLGPTYFKFLDSLFKSIPI